MAKATKRKSTVAAGRTTIFPAPDHDHARCSSDAMTVAEASCVERGQRLTPMRRKVLAVLLGSHQPLGAYDIMERLSPGGPRPAPITVYRALDFLCENGFVHRIESRNAYLACVRPHVTDDPILFLICERCGAVGEASSPEVASTIKSAAQSAGFTPKSPVIEIGGICMHCGKQTTEDRRQRTDERASRI
jgi:Fur family transcriptional regulator, zinc uptake regulator